eukprot:TRINITY_DN11158_c0_g1_i1.p1 TRINITY_DN11158_c0_g1~~TRINITY_DN11158_c0_g1_i1.p1  ORF type:complete len:521 (+),score=98.00 TRINITY_DN11158_c0_g1_i1:73-1635(+)
MPEKLSVRSEVFDHGLSFLLPTGKADLPTLFEVASLLRREDPASVRLPAWIKVATKCFRISESTAKLVFSVFLSLIDREGSKDPESAAALPRSLSEFLLFLFLQTFHKALLRPPYLALGESYPSSERSPANAQNLSSRLASEETRQHDFVKSHLGEMLALISGVSVAQLSREKDILVGRTHVDALGFLLSPTSSRSDGIASTIPTLLFKYEKKALAYDIREFISNSLYLKSATIIPTPQSEDRNFMGEYLLTSPKSYAIYNQSRKTIVKTEVEMKDSTLRIYLCNKSYIYILAPLNFVTIAGCKNCTIVVGAVRNVLSIEECEHVRVISLCNSLRVRNSQDCTFNLCTNLNPILSGTNSRITFGPYNTSYPSVKEHLTVCAIFPEINKWDLPINVAGLTPLTPSSQAAEGKRTDNGDTPYSVMAPESFTPFTVPFSFDGEPTTNPTIVPQAYIDALQMKLQTVNSVKNLMKESSLDPVSQSKLQGIIEGQFQEWLASSGNLRQIQDLLAIQAELQNTASQ